MPNTRVKMKFGLNFLEESPLPEVLNWCKTAEDAGFHMVGLADSPVLVRELYVSSAYCAVNTSRVQISSAVTNPMTRHPSVTASGLFSLDELAPGRISLGIATGDSAIWGVGGKFSTVAHLREYILAVKWMLRGEEVEYQGKRFKPEWRHWSPPKNIPIYVACSGPKVLKMSAQVADGMILAMGLAPENIQYIRDIIREGCAEIGRNPDDLDLWWTGGITFAPSVEEAMKSTLQMAVSWMVMGSMEGKQIPEEYKEPLKKLAEGSHNFSNTYLNANRGRMEVELAKELGIYDWLLSRAARLWGTPDDVNKRLQEFGEMGLTNWLFYMGGHPDKLGFIDKVAKGVIPNFT